MLTFRFVNQQQAYIYYNYRKETAKINVGAAVGAYKEERVRIRIVDVYSFERTKHINSETSS